MIDLADHDEELRHPEVELVTATASRADIISALRSSAAFFFDFFIGEELTSAVPEFHVDIWAKLTDHERERNTLAIPRGHNKTTMAKLSVVWHWLFTRHRFCVYLSNTNAIALNACKDIIGYLKSENFSNTFGEIKVIKESESHSLWIYEIKDAEGRPKRVILRALGANQQVRGINVDNQRPDFTVVDDVEDNDIVRSEALSTKLKEWVYGPFLKCLARNRRRIIWLGNMLSKNSLLAQLTRNPRWNPVVYGAIIKDSATGNLVPLWPEMWSMEELMEDFREHKLAGVQESWFCEMMNMPGHLKDGFSADSIRYHPTPNLDQVVATFITIDPAFSKAKDSDETAIVVHAILESGTPMVVDYTTSKFDESEMFEAAFSLATKWDAWCWGIESVAAQRVLIPLFNLMVVEKRLNHDIAFVPLVAGTDKSKLSRMSAWVSLMASGGYYVPEDDFSISTQLLEIDFKSKKNKDDLIDSCSYGPQMLEEYLQLITDCFNRDFVPDTHPVIGRNVCNV